MAVKKKKNVKTKKNPKNEDNLEFSIRYRLAESSLWETLCHISEGLYIHERPCCIIARDSGSLANHYEDLAEAAITKGKDHIFVDKLIGLSESIQELMVAAKLE